MIRQLPDPAVALASGHGAPGRAGGQAGAGRVREVEVSAARSAQVRAAIARPVRASSSSLVSRPSTNASLSILDHAVAVGVPRLELVTARRGWILRSCHDRHLPRSHDAGQA